MGCCGEGTRVDTAKVNGRTLVAPEVDANFDGPTKDRSCRDVVWLILFIAFCIGGIIYLAVAYAQGNLNQLIHGSDLYGNICGTKNEKLFNVSESGKDFTNKPYFIVEDVECAAECGARTQLGYYCLPKDKSKTEAEKEVESFFMRIGRDIQVAWREIVYTVLVGFALSIIMVLMLRFLAAIIVWLTVIVIVLGLIALTVTAWVFYIKAKDDPRYADHETQFLVGAIVATIISVIVIVLLIAMRKRIKLVIELFKEAGKAISAMPLIILMPVFTIVILIVVSAVSAAGLIIITAATEPKLYLGEYILYQPIPIIQYVSIYHIFGFFWVTQFVVACQDIAVAGAISTWYFKRDKKKLGWPILTGLKNVIFYHLGSAALGSLIIAIVKLIRYLLKRAQTKFKGNAPLAACLCCIQCCLACFEKFLKFLTRNAYIEIAIYGYGFCKSAQKAFAVITQNAFRVAAINFVGDFVLLLNKLAVLVLTGFIGYKIVETNKAVEYVFLPMVIGLICVGLIVHCFVSIYEMAIDTLFVCFCEDCNMNDGLSKPYFMSKGLMQFVENSKKALEHLDAKKKAQKNNEPWARQVQQYEPHQIGASALPSQMPTPMHHPTGLGMSPLHPAYQPNSMPPSIN